MESEGVGCNEITSQKCVTSQEAHEADELIANKSKISLI